MLWWLLAFWCLPPLLLLIGYLVVLLKRIRRSPQKLSRTDSISGSDRALNVTDTCCNGFKT
jgi:hypothetical protein